MKPSFYETQEIWDEYVFAVETKSCANSIKAVFPSINKSKQLSSIASGLRDFPKSTKG